MLIFQTKLEQIFNWEYGKLQFKILIQWIRFLNVMIITSLILGIITYYTMVRIIYWLTKLDKHTEKSIIDIKTHNGELTKINRIPIIESLSKEDEEFWRNKINGNERLFNNIDDNNDSNDTITYNNNNPINNKTTEENVIMMDNNEEDLSTYGGLNSLNSLNSISNSSNETSPNQDQIKDIPIDTDTPSSTLRSRQQQSTRSTSSTSGTGTSIFSRLNLTPISTITEDSDEDYEK
ncbi:hypothetical protein BN7_2976 [Wickerhamomyces ciferrii]|uniref:Uncharacterized protein n=1 Tax=Wickerhamomyces ciferrii (strain ATCC 14091 / BCRC 22168 / CBS 111 / JCM 3599 / NBRC 0793 / NRRL Y-1031 F-60-10) TaxID=1206466 RepID=K0KQC2_WICCF|nr:uncharacterized protein BN7_2976 [Wickerhamomyces ciferrii]CCH43428.1 hypothetical protein BN7_2976 [Wickerhamomyces ciferrii]